MPPTHVEGGKKRSRKSITLETKLEVSRRIEAGEKIFQICSALGLAKSTVQTIRNNKDKIKAHVHSAASLSMCTKLIRKRSDIMEKMEKMLILWMEDNKKRNVPMSEIMIQKKAKSIFENLKLEYADEPSKNKIFLGSRGWYEKFKKRHSLHNIKMKGEAASADPVAAFDYPTIFKKIVEEGGYVPEQVFNADETDLYWKRMPERTLILNDEKSASGYKVSEERLTLLLGANAAGDFKLKPLLVYLSENRRDFKGLNKKELPVTWKSNKKAWMTKALFEDWLKNYFCPEVKTYLEKKNLSNKVLLLLNNTPGHSVNFDKLSANVRVEYLPKNSTALIQPMDQGVIATFKAYYLRRTFQKLVHETNGRSSIKQFWKNYNIEDAIYNIIESWNQLKSTAMNHVWKKLWPECVTNGQSDADPVIPEIERNILNLAMEIGFEDLEEHDATSHLNTNIAPLSNKDFKIKMELESDQESNEEPEPFTSRQLTSRNLCEALQHFQEGLEILNQNDPDEGRSAEVSRAVNEAINCYKEIKQKLKHKVKQPTLERFFKPAAARVDDTDSSSSSSTLTC